jgi:hypothetical protein
MMVGNSTRAQWWSREWLVYAAAGLVTPALTSLSLRLWTARFDVPFTYAGDALPTGAHFKTVIEEGWYEYQPRLGAPFGQTYNDFPTADNLHLVAAKLLALFTGDWAVALNAYFLIGFVLAAFSAVWLFRICGISKPLTIVMATLFALAPYHFLRGQSHLWLASYYAIPLGIGLLVLLLTRRALWGKGTHPVPVIAWAFGPASRTVVFLSLLATSSSYYGVFFLFLLATTGLVVLVRDRKWKPFLGAAAAGVVALLVMLANTLPDFIFSRMNGANELGLERAHGETEVYALKLAQLLLPWPGHRSDLLRSIRNRYDAAYPTLSEQPALGLVAAVGLLAAFALIALLLVRRAPLGSTRAEDPRWILLGGLALLVFVAFLFSTIGGFSTIVSFFTSSLRGWNRMSIVIAALCLAIVGLLLDLAWERLRARTTRWAAVPRRLVGATLCLALVGVGFYDQTPAVSSVGYQEAAARFDADRAWIARLEAQLAPESKVLLLPHIPFPESSSANGFLSSSQLVPYLHSSTLRWSNGGIKGRIQADWPGQLDDYPTSELAALATTADFSGIMLTKAAYVDGGKSVEQAVQDNTGITPQHSADDRYVFFNLEALGQALAGTPGRGLREAISASITNPVTPYPYPGFSSRYEKTTGDPYFGGKGTAAAFTLVNDSSVARQVRVSFQVTSGVPQGTVTVSLPDGTRVVADHVTSTVDIDATYAAAPGKTQIVVDLADAVGNPVDESIVRQLSVTDVEVVEYLASVKS